MKQVDLKEINQELRKILNERLIAFGINPDKLLPISWEETKASIKELANYYKVEV